MHRLLLDTNVLVDFMVPDRPGSDAAVEVIGRCVRGKAEGLVCAGSLKDVYYVARKHLGERAARDFVRTFLVALRVLPLDDALCRLAADSYEPDFEDAIVRTSAEDAHADFILTRDVEAFQRGTTRAMSAERYVSLFPQPT